MMEIIEKIKCKIDGSKQKESGHQFPGTSFLPPPGKECQHSKNNALING
jgi:hypothetical protein